MDEPALKGLAICTTPRSGSNLLCEAMTVTAVLGQPLEYFNQPARIRYGQSDYPKDPRAQVGRILTAGRSANGVYAFKVFPGQSRKVMRRLDWTRELPNLSYVFLSREDMLGQAISFDLAARSNRFRSTDDIATDPAYDAREIRRRLDALERQNADWERFFRRRGIAPLRLRYEDVAGDLAGAVSRIGALAGVDATLPADWRPELSRQRDDINAAWRQKFLQSADARTRGWRRWFRLW